ncbi:MULTISPECIES: peptidoglycan-binding protein [Streptacidiphilus]|uniref:Peptidoglycan-binding protein n=1 Tax=Streptacidiphilus cavernicola TaxID=3342716 RepID=A0ABV6UYI3_9ACTN|nr:peptidoglycan-binding protein [Streptacidiphilus jeojiense]
MARWKALPGGLDPAVVEFVGGLRSAKDDSGLTLRRLAVRTGYSASSWERYLGGRLLPPPEAVEALAELAGTDSARLLARYEMAADAWRREQPEDSGQPGDDGVAPVGQDVGPDVGPDDPSAVPVQAASTADEAEPAPPAEPVVHAVPAVTAPAGQRSRARLQLLVTAVVSAALGATVATLVVLAGQGRSVAAPARVGAVARPVDYACDYVRRAGRWYAGNSTTLTDPLEVDMSGPEVAELQCLLQRAGISPGGIDGNFGPLTEAAVIQAQKTYRLDVDGQVGPRTWAALRG